MKKYALEKIIKKSISIHGYRYRYLSENYDNIKGYADIACEIHGVFRNHGISTFVDEVAPSA